MPESFVQVTEGSGKKLHTFQRTVGANNVEDEVVALGEPYVATYTVGAGLKSLATINSHVLQLMAGASLKVYIRRIVIVQDALATTAGLHRIAIYRLTTAGTGGAGEVVSPLDTGDAAAGMTAMSLPSSKGTEGALLWVQTGMFIQTVPTGGPASAPILWEWSQERHGKPIIIPAGSGNGIAVKNLTAVTGAQLGINIIATEQNF